MQKVTVHLLVVKEKGGSSLTVHIAMKYYYLLVKRCHLKIVNIICTYIGKRGCSFALDFHVYICRHYQALPHSVIHKCTLKREDKKMLEIRENFHGILPSLSVAYTWHVCLMFLCPSVQIKPSLKGKFSPSKVCCCTVSAHGITKIV